MPQNLAKSSLYFWRWICLNLTTTKSNSNKKNGINLLKSNKGKKKTYAAFPHIVSTDTILFWIWKSEGHSTYWPKIAVHKSKDHSNFEKLTLWNLIKSMNIHSRSITYLTFKNKTLVFVIKIKKVSQWNSFFTKWAASVILGKNY